LALFFRSVFSPFFRPPPVYPALLFLVAGFDIPFLVFSALLQPIASKRPSPSQNGSLFFLLRHYFSPLVPRCQELVSPPPPSHNHNSHKPGGSTSPPPPPPRPTPPFHPPSPSPPTSVPPSLRCNGRRSFPRGALIGVNLGCKILMTGTLCTSIHHRYVSRFTTNTIPHSFARVRVQSDASPFPLPTCVLYIHFDKTQTQIRETFDFPLLLDNHRSTPCVLLVLLIKMIRL